MPDMDAYQAYDRRYRLYQRIIDCLEPIWDDVQKCIEG